MNFIKKVFDGNPDEATHLQFQKFSKGEFLNRAIVEVKKTGKGYSIKTSAEFSNGLVKDMAEKLGAEKTKITGAIVSTSDLTGELEFKGKKQFQGVKRYLIDNEMSGEEILGLIEKFPKNFFALTFEIGENKLKIKPKAPKSGKPGKDGKEVKADFCSLKTRDEEIVKNFVFETSNFKEARINHTFFIDEIIMPESKSEICTDSSSEKPNQGEKDYARIRELAKRRGKIFRRAIIDGVSSEKTAEFTT